MREQNRLPRYKNKPALVRSHSSPSPVNQLIAPSSTPPTSSTTFTVKYNPAPLKRSSSNTFTPTDSPAPSQTIPYKATLVATSSLPSTPRSIGFSFRPFYVKTTYFCEHDDPEDDKVTTYITWVNNQLARGNGTTPITNLERGISDGTTLPQLLHILGDEAVADAVIPPKSESQRKQNIRLCFQYLQQRHIHPRNTTASDVSSGNVKCIMRLLLALAANFKTYRPDTRSVRYMASISEGGACNGSPHSPAPADPCDLGDEEEMSWMYDQVIDTKKQLESLKHLLLKDITDNSSNCKH